MKDNRRLHAFLFGNEKPGVRGFCRLALFRCSLLYPFCILLSNSLTDAWDVVLVLLWLLSGNWAERFRIFKRSPFLWCSLSLLIISFLGVFQYETTLFHAIKYWRGHHPIPILIVLATLFSTQTYRVRMLGALGLAMAILLPYSVLVNSVFSEEILEFAKPPHIARNTIWLGMTFVIWAFLWIVIPYSSRWNPSLRPCLRGPWRRSMREASVMTPHEQIGSFFRNSLRTKCLLLLRWGIVTFCIVYIFWFNPSRTACLAVLSGVSALWISHNWKHGLLISVVAGFVILPAIYMTSPVLQRRIDGAIREVNWFLNSGPDAQQSKRPLVNARMNLYRKAPGDILRNPLGIGMEKTRQKCREYSDGRLDNLHSEFFAFGMHSGWLGLALFLLWFFLLFRHSLSLEPPWRQLGIFVSVTLFVDCLFNGALSQNMEGNLYSILIALIASCEPGKIGIARNC